VARAMTQVSVEILARFEGHRVWRHRKGGVYTVFGVLAGIVFYAAHKDGTMWYRPADEFLDGRFEPLEGEAPLTPEEAGMRQG